jgi:hypothetical protein
VIGCDVFSGEDQKIWSIERKLVKNDFAIDEKNDPFPVNIVWKFEMLFSCDIIGFATLWFKNDVNQCVIVCLFMAHLWLFQEDYEDICGIFLLMKRLLIPISILTPTLKE